MKIGIFGGSFNPPHKMHVDIAKECIEKHYVDEIIFVPTGIKYKYKSNLLPNETRHDLLNILVSKNKNFHVSTYEFKEEVVYTYETLNHFKEKYPQAEIYFICGTDNLSYLKTWKNGEEILKNNKILVIRRDTNNIEDILEEYKEYKDNIIVTDIAPVSISSTEIRDLIKENSYDKLESLMDKDIINYIKENNLYQEEV